MGVRVSRGIYGRLLKPGDKWDAIFLMRVLSIRECMMRFCMINIIQLCETCYYGIAYFDILHDHETVWLFRSSQNIVLVTDDVRNSLCPILSSRTRDFFLA